MAVGLARLAVPTAFLARVSSDAFGQLLREHLEGGNRAQDEGHLQTGPEQRKGSETRTPTFTVGLFCAKRFLSERP